MLIVDDDLDAAELLSETLAHRGFVVSAASSAEQALALLREGSNPEVVLTDLRMEGATGIDLASTVAREMPGLPVVLITAFGTIRAAIDAIQRGAYDFLTKPYDPEMVALTLDRAVERARSIDELRRMRDTLADDHDGIVTRSAAMLRTLETVDRIATTDVPVLITGETGTGKELVARRLHRRSNRARGPFVAINCAALPEALLESELFGHTRGAFTDAHSARVGLFSRASGGTMFLDEIAEMPVPMQTKLLRVLQEGRVRAVGDDRDHAVDVRLVAATHRDIEAEVRAGRFREDLFFRIHVVEVSLPPLRARGDDALVLAHEFLARACARSGRSTPMITPAVARLLLAYEWPGNVRELQNVVEASLAMCDGTELGEDALPTRVRNHVDARPTASAPSDAETEAAGPILPLEEVERRHVLFAMRLLRGNRKNVAEALGLDRSTLYRKLLRYGVQGEADRAGSPTQGTPAGETGGGGQRTRGAS